MEVLKRRWRAALVTAVYGDVLVALGSSERWHIDPAVGVGVVAREIGFEERRSRNGGTWRRV